MVSATETYQFGRRNIVAIAQFGGGHTAITSQDGNGNAVGVIQAGRNNSTNVTQIGRAMFPSSKHDWPLSQLHGATLQLVV
jgi:hypothetical protein